VLTRYGTPRIEINGLMREPTFVDTPRGIFTSGGIWFRTREASLREYAGGVLDHVPLPRLLGMAETWLRSGETLVLWLLPALLFEPVSGVFITLVLYAIWKALLPVLVTRSEIKVFSRLDHVFLQAAYYIIVLSLYGMSGRPAAVWIGLAGFILVRWQLLPRLFDLILQPVWRWMYKAPLADQVMHALIVRMALKYNVRLRDLDLMEAQIRDTLNRKHKQI